MKCKNCKNLVKRIDDDGTLYDFCGMVIDSPDTGRERNCKYYVTATNADRIRAMTDEELAELFTHPWGCNFTFCCPAADDVGEGTCASNENCRECFFNWLKQEAET